MFRIYGLSQVGQYHLNEGSTTCQDFNSIERITENVVVAAVADGVGSEKYSEIGSKIAAESCVKFCKSNYGTYDDKKELLHNAYKKAFYSVEVQSNECGIPLNQMDCTLCTVLITPEKLYLGNIGDSGAIGLKTSGEYVCLTEQQNDENGSVYPLIDANMWSFSEIENDFTSILVATDGFYNRLFPKYLLNKIKNGIDFELLREYIDPDYIPIYKSDAILSDYIKNNLSNIPKDGTWDGISDDITVVGIISDKPHGIFKEYTDLINRLDLKKEYSEKIRDVLYGRSKNITKNPDNTVNEKSPTQIYNNSPPTSGNCNECQKSISKIELKYSKLKFIEWPKTDKSYDELNSKNPDPDSLQHFLENIETYSIPRRTKIAYNIASALSTCHRHGLILGIFSTNNIKINDKGGISFYNLNPDLISDDQTEVSINTNAVSIDENVYPTKITPTYCPIDEKLENMVLAVIIFRLIFNGKSPYAVNKKGNFDFFYKLNRPDIAMPDIGQFPNYLTNLFEKAFDDDCIENIPKSEDWRNALDHYSVDIVMCSKNKKHIHYVNAKFCPYCNVEYALQVHPDNKF